MDTHRRQRSEREPHLADVSVIVLSYGKPNPARGLIERLLAGGELEPSQVLQVHNPRAPGESADAALARVLNLPYNMGYAGGMNAGLEDERVSEAAFVLLLTHDVRLDISDVIELRNALVRDDGLYAVGPVLHNAQEPWSFGLSLRRPWHYRHNRIAPSKDVVVVDALDGSALMLRSSRVGDRRFDERFFMYFEEIDLLAGLERSGAGAAALVTRATAQSEPGDGRRPRANAYLMSRNGLMVALRYGGRRACLEYGAFALAAALLDAIRAVASRETPERRRETRQRVLATLRGEAAFLARRTGPPPSAFADGDMT